MKDISQYLPLVAILRGVKPDEVCAVAQCLIDEGFGMIEVPLNSPNPFESIRNLSEQYGDKYLIGAGTVLSVADVENVAKAGGQLVVSPNTNAQVIKAAKAKSMMVLPGCLTPTEAFTALEAGADGLKFFPASSMNLSLFKGLKAVLPTDTLMYAVGGVDHTNMADYFAVGINGIGLGSSLYKAGKSLVEIQKSAQLSVSALQRLME